MGNSKSETSIIIKWLKRIFSWKIISGIATILGVYFAYTQFLREEGGSLTVSINGNEIFNNEEVNNIIFLEDKTTKIPDIFFQSLHNNQKYTIKDLFLQYQINTNNVNLSTSDFYNKIKSNNQTTLRYNDNILYPFSFAEKPITNIDSLDSNSWFSVEMRATYNGIPQPYIHRINNYFYIIPKDDNCRFDEWKDQCKKFILGRATASYLNTYYITHSDYAFESLISTSAINEINNTSNLQNIKKQKLTKDNINTNGSINEINNYSLLYSDSINSPIEINSLDTFSMSDGTLLTTIKFKPIEFDTTLYFVFDYTTKGTIYRNTVIFRNNLAQGDSITYYNIPSIHNLNSYRFIGFAIEKPELANFISFNAQPNKTTLLNNSNYRIGIDIGRPKVLNEKSSISLNSNLNKSEVKYLQIPSKDWRSSLFEKNMFDQYGRPTLKFNILMGFSGYFMLLCLIPILLISIYILYIVIFLRSINSLITLIKFVINTFFDNLFIMVVIILLFSICTYYYFLCLSFFSPN